MSYSIWNRHCTGAARIAQSLQSGGGHIWGSDQLLLCDFNRWRAHVAVPHA